MPVTYIEFTQGHTMVIQQPRTISDEEWMQGLSAGDFQCAAHLFERYQVSLFNFFRRMGCEHAISEDLTQTVFERVIRYRASFRSDSSFKSWLYQIARNVSKDFFNKNRIKVADFAEAEGIQETDAPMSAQMEAAEDVQMLHQALAQLPDDQREILVLTRFQEMKYSEAAKVLGLTESNAKVKAHRAIKQLRDIYFKIQNL